MTIRLYDTDSHCREFEAEVLSCTTKDGTIEAVLDRTAFFPEGGGQKADTGRLGSAQVLGALERDGEVIHILSEEIPAGSAVTGILDYEQRFARMQNHSGEHIFSGLVHNRFGYDNVGFHLGDGEVTLDFSGPLTEEQILEIEKTANEVVTANLPIEVFYPSPEEAELLDYRSKKEIGSDLRLVRIPGVDLCACCAPHVKLTGEIGLIHITRFENYKGGTRLTMLAGSWALADYQRKEADAAAVSEALSAPREDLMPAVARLQEQEAAGRNEIYELWKQMVRLKVEGLSGSGGAVLLYENGMPSWAVRQYVNEAVEKLGGLVLAVFREKGSLRYIAGAGEGADAKAFGTKLNERFRGKGGGNAKMVQGSFGSEPSEEEIRAWLAEY